MAETVYIRLKKKLTVKELKTVYLKDIAHLTAPSNDLHELIHIPLYTLTKDDHNIVIIDSFIVIKHLKQQFPHLNFELIGFNETVIRLDQKRQKPRIIFVIFVWILLFIGTAMTMINFHYDVSMQEVQQKLHFILTGEEVQYPLKLQIPYSIGLGIGMILFLNRLFKTKFNEEPSPLEVELYKYQKSIDDYLAYSENVLNDEKYDI